ncbi:glycosyltransferase [Ornithinimicrobium sp. Y1694]|uniref:glycosyltransferase n=1 Tax=Ornithinimicrobium sp. Y1694 TaxID=3418590 RepID=UPI003CFAE57A
MSAAEIPVATRAGVSRDTARNQILLDHPDALAATALRTRSIHAREVLVEAAWPGATPEQVDAWAQEVCRARSATQAGTHAGLPDGVAAYHLGQYARVLILQTPDPAEIARGRRLLEALDACGELAGLHPQAAQLLLHLRCLDRDPDGVADLLDRHELQIPEDVADAVRADLANPFLTTLRSDDTATPDSGRIGAQVAAEVAAQVETADWLALLDRALHSSVLAPLSLSPTGTTPFDRLSTQPARLPRADVDGRALVTVVVSAYRPGAPLLTAVRSLLAQTWQALEILVVDDTSGPDAEPWLQQAEALDPRVRVIRKAVNGGTYRARNTALRQARGAYLTTLDSDDWLHPQAIATLVEALEADPSRMATRGLGARVDENLALVRLGYRHRAIAAPTLLIRLDPVLSRLGFFDPARKSADTEYARRIQAAFGENAVHTVDECLLLLRSGQTLSSSEFTRMWRHGARHAYKTLYAPWHEEIRSGAAAYLDPVESRPIPEPRRWTAPAPRDPALPAPRHLDLVLGGDWRRYGGPQRSMLEEIRAAREAGLQVGVLHLEALRFATTKDLPLCAPIVDLIRRGEVEWIQIDDDVDVDVLMVRYPLVLQHPPSVPQPRPLRPRHLLVMANQAPLEPDGSDQRYVVADVTERARELFGTDPVWVPQGPVIRELLRAQDPQIRLTEWDNPGLIDVAQWRRKHAVPERGERAVVVGRFSRDHPLKHPVSADELLAAYDLGEGYAVRMMGTRATWKRLLAEAGRPEETPTPANWELLRAGSVEPQDFLAGLDFFLYQDHPERHEAFGRVLLEAAASGLVVIAHPKHRPVFGDLLDYAEPAGSRAVIESYLTDPARYAARVAQVQHLVAERFSHASFVDRLRTLDGMAQAWAGARAEGGADSAGQDGRGNVEARGSGQLTRHEVRLRSAADGARADLAVLLHSGAALSTTDRDRFAQALATPADGAVDAALADALVDSDGVAAVVLTRDGVEQVLTGPTAPVGLTAPVADRG